jgi:ribosomal protein S18 acetylase RimI-like enzyme
MMSAPYRYVFRPAESADVDAITEVWYAGWREAHLGHLPEALLAHRSPQQFRDRLPDILATTTVATIGGQVAGLVVTTSDEIEQLYVAAQHRGTGTATALLRHGESMIARDFPTAFLAVVAGNTRARHFYEREGWQDTGPFDYHAWTSDGDPVAVPCHRYEKDLLRGGVR